jgi:AraC family transcriptional activator of pobA
MNELTSEYLPAVLPFQVMPGYESVQIFRFGDLTSDYTYRPHRHQFNMVLWVTKGYGSQRIDFHDYDMQPGKLYFVRVGQMHQIKQYAEDGWMILMNEQASLGFNSVLMDYFYQNPVIDIKQLRCETFMGLFSLLQVEANKYSNNAKMIVNFLNGMLLCAERCESFSDINISENLKMVKTLKALIEDHFKEEKEAEFYYSALGLPRRSIIKVIQPLLGKTVHELLQDRIMEEARVLLHTSSLSVNEISDVLGFNTPSYFCVVFKKMAGVTPNEYRFRKQI